MYDTPLAPRLQTITTVARRAAELGAAGISDAAQMITGALIDFDQTVLGPYGEHVATVR